MPKQFHNPHTGRFITERQWRSIQLREREPAEFDWEDLSDTFGEEQLYDEE